MKNNGDPSAMAGTRCLKQIRKQAAVIRGAPGRVKDGAYTILLLEEARKWLEQFYSETVGMSSGSSEAFDSRWAELDRAASVRGRYTSLPSQVQGSNLEAELLATAEGSG